MSSAEVERLLGQIKLLNRRLRREQSAVEGLSTAALVVLTTATRADTPQRPGQLAAELHMTTPNMAAALRALEEGGAIIRRPDPGDGRKVFVHVTEHGRDIVDRTASSRHGWLREAVEEALTDSERRLLFHAGDLIERIADHEAGLRLAGSQTRRAGARRD